MRREFFSRRLSGGFAVDQEGAGARKPRHKISPGDRSCKLFFVHVISSFSSCCSVVFIRYSDVVSAVRVIR